jgi:hypothetical protein
MAYPPPYPVCPVSDEINANHNGGRGLGLLYMDDITFSSGQAYCCAACFDVIGGVPGKPLRWPPPDMTAQGVVYPD